MKLVELIRTRRGLNAERCKLLLLSQHMGADTAKDEPRKDPEKDTISLLPTVILHMGVSRFGPLRHQSASAAPWPPLARSSRQRAPGK